MTRTTYLTKRFTPGCISPWACGWNDIGFWLRHCKSSTWLQMSVLSDVGVYSEWHNLCFMGYVKHFNKVSKYVCFCPLRSVPFSKLVVSLFFFFFLVLSTVPLKLTFQLFRSCFHYLHISRAGPSLIILKTKKWKFASYLQIAKFEDAVRVQTGVFDSSFLDRHLTRCSINCLKKKNSRQSATVCHF